MKKGSADMWWIIIGAVIAIIVMIVLVVIFSDTTGRAKVGLLDCESKGGVCNLTEDGCKEQEGKVSPVFSCEKPAEKCCFKG